MQGVLKGVRQDELAGGQAEQLIHADAGNIAHPTGADEPARHARVVRAHGNAHGFAGGQMQCLPTGSKRAQRVDGLADRGLGKHEKGGVATHFDNLAPRRRDGAFDLPAERINQAENVAAGVCSNVIPEAPDVNNRDDASRITGDDTSRITGEKRILRIHSVPLLQLMGF